MSDIRTKPSSNGYRTGWDLIEWANKPEYQPNKVDLMRALTFLKLKQVHVPDPDNMEDVIKLANETLKRDKLKLVE